MKESGRRRFLKSIPIIGAAGLPAPVFSAEQHAHPTSSPRSQAYMFLTEPEVAFVEAAVARLIPTDELGPGAKEAGVAYFIDRQLFGGFGTMAKMYRAGPWPEGTREQGYQSPLTPQQVYRIGIRAVDQHCVRQNGKSFAALGASQQDDVLHGLDEGKIELDTISAQFFFNMLLANTIEGFFSDPVYGGNRDKVGWKLVGFPGVAAVYTELVEKHGVPYEVQAVSILDVVEKKAELDDTGHPKHIRLARKD